jgi:hypothetical protein
VFNRQLSISLAVFLVTVLLLSTALGEQNNPEIIDEGGTNDTGDPTKQFQNIDKVWFGNEEEETFDITMELGGPPHDLLYLYQNGQIQNWTNYDYEVYFTVGKSTFAASVRIRYAVYLGAGTPLGGIISEDINWDWEIRNVSYASTISNDINSETESTNIAEHTYVQSSEETMLTWTIPKVAIGIETGALGRGSYLKDTWAAVWNADTHPPEQKRKYTSAFDTAKSYTNPGRDYQIKGGAVAYLIWLSTSNTEKYAMVEEPAEFFVDARNNGSNDFDVDIYPVHSGANGWTVSIDPSNITIAKDTTRTFKVTVTPPEDVVNGTTIVITINGNIHKVDGEGNETVPIHDQGQLDLKVTALTKEPEKKEKPFFEVFLDGLIGSISLIAALIAVIVVIAIIVVILKKR